MNRFTVALLVSWSLVVTSFCAPAIAAVPLWGRLDTRRTAAEGTSPDTRVTVEFTSPSGKKRTTAAFWDGGAQWGIRFMPGEEGMWSYKVTSDPKAEGLDGASGRFECSAVKEAENRFHKHGALTVADSGTYLAHADGTPFFWLGDTVWTGPANASIDDWQTYLKDRTAKNFSVVQFNMPCPWRTADHDRDGLVAFEGTKDIRINPRFYQRLDSFMDANERAGFLAAPVLIWSLTRKDPGAYLPDEDIEKIIRYELARYGAHHVVWMLAGDNRYDAPQAEKWKRIGRKVFAGGWHQPVTTHPTGVNWPWESWRDEKWLTVLGYQSGHGDDAKTLEWIHSGPVSKNWQNKPVRPIINLEPPYEDHNGYHSKKPHPAYHVRRAVYWSVLAAPPAGVTYGGHGLWSWQTEPGKQPPDHAGTGVAKLWHEALDLPGSTDMKHMAELFTSIEWWKLRPKPDLVDQPVDVDPTKFIAAADNGELALIYMPVGGNLRLKGVPPSAESKPDGDRTQWFDPRTGKRQQAQRSDGGYQTPTNEDWVLVVRH